MLFSACNSAQDSSTPENTTPNPSPDSTATPVVTPTPNASATHDYDSVSDEDYDSEFQSHYYASVEELYQGIKDLSKDDLESIRTRENQYLEDTKANTRVSEDELENGIFGSFRNKILEDKTLLLPFYQGKAIPVYSDDPPCIVLFETEFFRKPGVEWLGIIEDMYFGVNVRYYDKALINEANEKGASWLISQMDPDSVNVHNYEEHKKKWLANGLMGTKDVFYYEKDYHLGDRDVKAMVSENKDKDNPSLTIYFVYDNMLINVAMKTEHIDGILPDITFCEVDLSTNTPLRETPGREWSTFSIR